MANSVLTKDTTPTLDFADISGALEYQVQVDSDPRFNNIKAEGTGLGTSVFTPSSALADLKKYFWRFRARTSSALSTDQSNPTGGASGHALRDASARTALAQTFKATKGFPIKRVTISLKGVSSPTGTCWVEIWSTSGGVPSAQIGTDSATKDVSTIGTGSFEDVNLDFTTPPPVIAGVTYAILFFGDFTINASDYILWEHDGAGNYSNGSAFKLDGSLTVSANGSNDHIFDIQTHTWLNWSPTWSFWLDTTFDISLAPTKWTFVDPDATNDAYTMEVEPAHRIKPEKVRRSFERNIQGDLLSEYVALRERITLEQESAFIDYDQLAAILRFSEMRKPIFLIGITDYGQDKWERVWKVEFEDDPEYVPIADGVEEYYRLTMSFIESRTT